MSEYLNKTYQSNVRVWATGAPTSGGHYKNINIEPGDQFLVQCDDKPNFVCEYLGPSEQHRIGDLISVCPAWIDNNTELVTDETKMQKSSSQCECDSYDIAHINHMPDCAWLLAGGIEGEKLRAKTK